MEFEIIKASRFSLGYYKWRIRYSNDSLFGDSPNAVVESGWICGYEKAEQQLKKFLIDCADTVKSGKLQLATVRPLKPVVKQIAIDKE